MPFVLVVADTPYPAPAAPGREPDHVLRIAQDGPRGLYTMQRRRWAA
jgi:hypothetical protein